MATSFQPTRSKTSILDLNEDCLKAVFAHMDPETLTAVADVCTRFKQNAMHTASRTIKELWLHEKPSVYEYSMLRNFGEFIEKIEVVGYNVEKRIMEYVNLYCVGKCIELRWKYSRITHELAILIRPLLGRVQKLRFYECNMDEELLENLPLCQSISFHGVPDVKNAHIEKHLQLSPQLKHIELMACDSLDDGVFESIARNVPAIEKIEFQMHWKSESSNREHIKYFRQLNKLKSLTLGVYDDDSYIQSVVHEIARVNTGLEYLDVRNFDMRRNANQFIGDISKLTQLKTLRLERVRNFTAAHLIEICKHAREPSVIDCGNYGTLTYDNLLEIVKNAKKSQKFICLEELYRSNQIHAIINGNTFHEQEQVAQRNEKTKLCIYLKNLRIGL